MQALVEIDEDSLPDSGLTVAWNGVWTDAVHAEPRVGVGINGDSMEVVDSQDHLMAPHRETLQGYIGPQPAYAYAGYTNEDKAGKVPEMGCGYAAIMP